MTRKDDLYSKLKIYKQILEDSLIRLKEIEDDIVTQPKDKLSKIKKIKEEITKVGEQIDIVKKEIILLSSFNIN